MQRRRHQGERLSMSGKRESKFSINKSTISHILRFFLPSFLSSHRSQGKDVSLETVLTSCIEYLEDQEMEKKEEYLNFLREANEKEKKELENLEKERKGYQEQVDHAYDDMKKLPYELFAVWIHSGRPGAGHYQAFIRDFAQKKWWRFNDIVVEEVQELPLHLSPSQSSFKGKRGDCDERCYWWAQLGFCLCFNLFEQTIYSRNNLSSKCNSKAIRKPPSKRTISHIL